MGEQTPGAVSMDSLRELSVLAARRQGFLPEWLNGYALIGLVVSGIVPVLLPLSAAPKGAIIVGLVVAAFYLGMVMSPVFGSLADNTHTHRVMFIATFPISAAGAILFGFSDQTWQMLVCIFVVGAAAGAAQTLASTFILEGRTSSQWAVPIGWMRIAFGLGQTLGLGVSAYFAHRLQPGWITVGVLLVVGTLLGARKLPPIDRTAPATAAATAPARRRGPLAALAPIVASRFGIFLGCWLFAMLGLMTFYNVVPLVLKDTFGIDPSTTSIIFLVGAALGALLYPVCGVLSARWSSGRVLSIGIYVTLIGFIVLGLATFAHGPLGQVLACGCLVLIATAYPFQYIGATLVAADLAPGGEGAAMGLFNSGVGVGAIVGAIIPSFMADRLGYGSLIWFSLAAMILAVLFRFWLSASGPHPAAAG